MKGEVKVDANRDLCMEVVENPSEQSRIDASKVSVVIIVCVNELLRENVYESCDVKFLGYSNVGRVVIE